MKVTDVMNVVFFRDKILFVDNSFSKMQI